MSLAIIESRIEALLAEESRLRDSGDSLGYLRVSRELAATTSDVMYGDGGYVDPFPRLNHGDFAYPRFSAGKPWWELPVEPRESESLAPRLCPWCQSPSDPDDPEDLCAECREFVEDYASGEYTAAFAPTADGEETRLL